MRINIRASYDSFRELRTNNSYYIDKTGIIEEYLEEKIYDYKKEAERAFDFVRIKTLVEKVEKLEKIYNNLQRGKPKENWTVEEICSNIPYFNRLYDEITELTK